MLSHGDEAHVLSSSSCCRNPRGPAKTLSVLVFQRTNGSVCPLAPTATILSIMVRSFDCRHKSSDEVQPIIKGPTNNKSSCKETVRGGNPGVSTGPGFSLFLTSSQLCIVLRWLLFLFLKKKLKIYICIDFIFLLFFKNLSY